MTKLIDTQRPGKKRYRVRFQGGGGSRTAFFADACDAYRAFYLRERDVWENISEVKSNRKKDMTISSLLIFYFGKLCDDVELNRISRSYFKGQFHNFEKLRRQLDGINSSIKQLSPSDLTGITIHNHRLFLRRAYALAIEVGMCSRNPCNLRRTALHKSNSVSEEKFATHQQVKELMLIDDVRLRVAVYLGAACGLRISEVASLRFDNVKANSLIIDSHLTDAGILPGLKYGSRTLLPITDEFHKLLDDMPREGKFLFEKKGAGHYANLASFRRSVLKEAFNKVGMTAERKSFHALRHYAVSVWVGMGVPIEQISRWLDHASPAVTYATYAHLFEQGEHRCQLMLG